MCEPLRVFLEANAFYLNPVAMERRKKMLPVKFNRSFGSQLIEAAKFLVRSSQKFIEERTIDLPNETIGKRWVVVGTQNQLLASRFLAKQSPYCLVNAPGRKVPDGGTYLPWWRSSPLTCLPNFVANLLKASRKGHRAEINGNFYQMASAVGIYKNTCKVLREQRPEALILSDDHSSMGRAMAMAAKDTDIPVIYIQHACVGDDFPRLIYDLALLEGQDSLDKYQLNEDETKVELIGMPKLDSAVTFKNERRTLQQLGIVFNRIQQESEVVALTIAISQAFPTLDITVRPHPGDVRNFDFSHIANVNMSDSKTENSFDFLKKQDVIIGGNSSIHMEAALLNIYPIIYTFGMPNDEEFDFYGFVRYGLAPAYETTEPLVGKLRQLMKSKPDIHNKAAYYCATINTPWHGRAGELAFLKIDEFLAARKEKNRALQ